MRRMQKTFFSEKGATLVEFLVVAPMMLLLILGIVQSAFFFIAKTQVNYATDVAVRYAATRNGTVQSLQNGLRMGLLSMQSGSSTPGAADLAQRYAAIRTAMLNPLDNPVTVQRLNPTPNCFADWGVASGGRGSPRAIPNAHLNFRPTNVGARSRLSVQDCNILKVRVVYGYRPVTPIIRQLLMQTLRTIDPLNTMYMRDRIPIEAVALVHMQSDVRQ